MERTTLCSTGVSGPMAWLKNASRPPAASSSRSSLRNRFQQWSYRVTRLAATSPSHSPVSGTIAMFISMPSS